MGYCSVTNVLIKELVVMEAFIDFKVIAGWKGRNNHIFDLVLAKQLDDLDQAKQLTNWPQTLLVVILDKPDNQLLAHILEQAISNQVGGLMIISSLEPSISTELLGKADSVMIPVIYLPRGEFDQIVATLDQVRQLKQINFFNSYVKNNNSQLLYQLNNFGLEAGITYLEMILANKVVVLNSIFEPINTRSCPEKEHSLTLGELQQVKKTFFDQQRVQETGKGEEIIVLELTKITDKSSCQWCYLIQLKAAQACYGFLVMLSYEPAGELELAQLKNAAAPLVTELVKYNEIMETEKRYKENFIYDLLHNNFECQQTVIKQGQMWGWDFRKPHQLIILEAELSYYPTIQLVATRTMTRQFKNPIIIELSCQLVIIIPDITDKNRRDRRHDIINVVSSLQNTIGKELPQVPLTFGIGKFYSSIDLLYRSYQEAKTSLELGKYISHKNSITHFEDLGVMRLLSSIRYEQLEDFCLEHLGDLVEFDKNNQQNMMNTLQIYFKENGDFKATAKELFVHANTLRYRLKKIEEILGVNLQNTEDYLNLLVALKILAMGKKN